MAKDVIPLEILSSQLSDAINGRRVRAGLFTTFTFDPGFFELQILPILFDQTFSQTDKLRRIQLEDALRSVDHLAVYYDRSALAQDAEPAYLDYRRIDVRRKTGCFHPKVIFLIVDESLYENDVEESASTAVAQSLIVAVMSANLTRGGWWENVECAHIEEIPDKDVSESRFSYRKDLLALLARIRSNAGEDEPHQALEAIRGFLRDRATTEAFKTASIDGHYHTRLFCGQQQHRFSDWLRTFRLKRHDLNLEVISPYFDKHGIAPLMELIEATNPKEVRVYLPRDLDGSALVSEDVYQSTQDEVGIYWGDLPGMVLNRGRSEASDVLPPRRLHAKVYRLWNRQGIDLLIVGSVNLTSSAHSHGGAGNLESAFLMDGSNQGFPRRWWIDRIDGDVEEFTATMPTEEDGLEIAFLDVSLRYDWADHRLDYRLNGKAAEAFSVCELSGHQLFTVGKPDNLDWVACSSIAADAIRDYLGSSSFVLIRHAQGTWRVLVREENLGFRPSLLTQLTPEEIMAYWSLLTPDQRAAFIERVFSFGEDLEGIPVRSTARLDQLDTVFDRFSGIYHAFGCVRKYIEIALEEGRYSDATVRLYGAKYDSIPSLLQKIAESSDVDPIVKYVTFLSAKQLSDYVVSECPDFFQFAAGKTSLLDVELEKLADIRGELPIEEMEHSNRFLEWFEEAFLKVPSNDVSQS